MCAEIHAFFFTILTGVSLLASTLLMFTMREMLAAFEGDNRQTIGGPSNGALFWARYRFRGACAATLFIGMDLIVGVGTSYYIDDSGGVSLLMYLVFGFVFMLCHAGIGCVFLFYAERLMRPLRAHLATRLRLSLDRDNSISGSNAVAKRIAAVTLGLKMDGVALLSLVAIEIWYFLSLHAGSRTLLFSTRCFESRKVRRVASSQASIDISEAVPSGVFDSGLFESSMSALTVSQSELALGSLAL